MTMAIEERNRLIGENLRKYRLLKGLTQDELAEGLCSVSQLSKVENGKTYLKRTILKEMANRLGVTVERIESQDALLEELSETLQLALDSQTAGNKEKALELIHEVVSQSRNFGYEELYLDSLLLECQLLNSKNRCDEVIQIVHDLFQSDPELEDNRKLMFQFELGHAHERSGNLMAAYDAFSRAESLFDQSEGDLETRYKINYALARSNFIMNNNRTALRYFEKAEQVATQLSRHLWRIRSRYMKATMLKRLGEYEKAESIFMSTLKEAQDNQYLLDVALINNNLGCLFLEKGESGSAQLHLSRALKVYEILNQNYYKCDTLFHLAELKYQEGDLQQAMAYIDRLLIESESVANQTYMDRAKAVRLLSCIKGDQGDFEGRITHLEKSLKIYEDNHVMLEAYRIAKEIAEIFYEKNDSRTVEMYRKAVQYNERFLELNVRG